ncbi:MAG TPA: efflux RND transporter periplasmic adaptor subunit [Ginsengibacter sp.]
MTYKRLYLFSFLICGIIMASCGDEKSDAAKQQQAPPPTPVTITEVKSTNAVYYDEYPAAISALDQINITSQVTGYVTAIHFKDGQKVKKGELLYSIDQQIYQANLQQALANLQVQEANLLKSSKDADRYHELDKHDAVAKQQVDYADAALEVSKKQVAAAKANVSSIQSNVQFSSIHSPLSGTIGISQVKQGTLVNAGQTVLNTVSTDNPIAVDFTIDQKEIYRFMKLKDEGTEPKDSVFTIAFGDEVYPYPGKISLIDRAVDPQTGTLKTRLVFPNDRGMLKAGMNTTVRVKNTAGQKSTIIPYKAVTEQLGEFFVYVVGDSSKVSQQKVLLGRQIGTNVIVMNGLKDGDKIAVEGVQNLHQGSTVTTAAPNSSMQQQKK